MNRWFQKGNSRRFFRIDMPLRLFVTPSSPIKDREIYATGADYFPPGIKKRLQEQKTDTHYWLSRVQDQKILVTELFNEVIDFIEFFGECAISISQGINPRLDPKYWVQLNQKKQGFQKVEALFESAPKTYRYFKLIEDKYMTFLESMIHSITHSTQSHFEANRNLPYGFKIDETLELFKKEKFSKVPLVQGILSLCQLMNIYLEAYRHINDDNVLRQYPTEWKLQQANVSASGLAVLLEKRFEAFEKVDVFFYFPTQEKILQFSGSIVDIRTIDDAYKERVAINFEFPDGSNQDFLQNEIQRFEIEECMHFNLTSFSALIADNEGEN